MGDTLEIMNFGAIRSMKVEIKPLMVFIGSQGTGKSTVSKLLTIFNDYWWYRKLLKKEDVHEEFKIMGIDKYFQKDTYFNYSANDIIITYRSGEFSLECSAMPCEEILNAIEQRLVEASGHMLKELGMDPNVKLTNKEVRDNVMVIRSNSRTLCYIPTERSMAPALADSFINITLNKIPLPYTIVEYLALYEKAKASITSFKSDFLNVSYSSEKEDENICIDSVADKWLTLRECSSGVQSTLPMQMIIEYCRRTESFDRYVVEEPEENLFPENQYELLKFLLSYYNNLEHRSDFILNTHSPYILTALNVALLAYKVGNNPDFKETVQAILQSEYWAAPDDVAVYALGYPDGEYCRSLIDEQTGIISVNFLDSASENIGRDFNRLYELYIKSLKNE